MKEELLITTRLPRRMFYKLIRRLDAEKDTAIEAMERVRGSETDVAKEISKNSMNEIREIDLLIEALFEED